MQPSIANQLISVSSCRLISGEYYIRSNVNYKCYTPEHILNIIVIIIPGILLWTFFFPFGILLFLYLRKKKLNENYYKFCINFF